MNEAKKKTYFKIAILWLAILLLGSFWLTVNASAAPIALSVMPQVPREGEPIIATFKLSNPYAETLDVGYRLYANGELLKEGATSIAPKSNKTYEYTYSNPLPLGEQLSFVVKTSSAKGDYDKSLSSPPYPPQILSSFVSFASFSTSVMSSIATMTYYQTNFSNAMGINLGIAITAVLVALLIFVELTKPVIMNKTILSLGKLHVRLSAISWILFLIFCGAAYTEVVTILSF